MFYDHTGTPTTMEKIKNETDNRNAIVIAAQIMCELPNSQYKFRDELYDFVMQKVYSSPELCKSKEFWFQLQKIMHTHIEIPKEDWEKKIVNIYTSNTHLS
jgi:hypothetical protein